MSRNLLALAAGILFTCLSLSAQPVLTVSEETANPGDMVDVNVTVDGYQDYISLQFSVNWDPSIADFVELKDFTTGLPGFSQVSSVNVNAAAGRMTVSWFEASITPQTLPDGENLFTIVFEAVGDECDRSPVDITNTPLSIEIVDADENIAETTVNNGYVDIPGTDCTSETLIITGSEHIVSNGTQVCVSFTCENFVGVAAAQFSLAFDPTVLDFTSIENVNWPGATAGGNFGTTGADQGEITFVWFDQNAVGVDVPDGTVLFEVCFDVIGSGGQMSEIAFGDDPRPIEFSDADGNMIDFDSNAGRVTVEGTFEGFGLLPEQGVTGSPGDIVCMDIEVNDFNEIISMQFSINWDSTVMIFDHVEGFNLPDFSATNVAGPDAPLLSEGQAAVLWFDQTVSGVTVPNGTSIFSICFELVGDCDDMTTVNITSDPLDIEVSDNDDVLDVGTLPGDVTIVCGGCEATVETVIDPSCNGAEDGSIDIEVSGCPEPITYEWSNGATTQDISNLSAGDYQVTITVGTGDVIVLDTVVLEDPDPIVANATITDVVDMNDGAIDLEVEGGTPPYTYMWSNGETTQDLSDLPPGEYTVTITDNNKCTLVAGPYVVRDGGAISADVTNVACFGDSTGAIIITSINCGPEPYTFEWSNGSTQRDQMNLPAGMYSLTVTANNGDECETEFTVSQPETPIVIDADTTNETSAGNDGSIMLTVAGGQPPYTYRWSNGETTKDIDGLSAGEYTVTVTDDLGCQLVETILIRGLELFIDIEMADYNGFGVSCTGECDGLLVASAGNGVGDITYEWSNGEDSPINAEVCAGTYTLTVTDELGQTAETTVEVTEPTPLIIEIDVTCASEPGTADGSAIAIVSGGVPPYSYLWNTGEMSSSISDKEPGPLVAIVTDDNNCQSMEQSEICISGIECYQAMTAMTPNGDGKNDQFKIQCIFELPNRLTIFNRYGGEEFRMDNYDNSWEGTDNNGNQLSDGGYHWVLEVFLDNGDTRVYQGTVSLVRSFD